MDRREFIKLCAVALSVPSISYTGSTSNGLIDPMQDYIKALVSATTRKTDDIILSVFQ